MPQPWFSHQVRKKFLISHIHSAFAAFAAVPSVKLPVGLEETIMARDFDAGSCLARFGLDWTKAKVMAYGKRELPLHTHRFLQLQKNGRLAGYNFIGWLKKTGELVKDACPQSPHTPIYWKMPETGKRCDTFCEGLETPRAELSAQVDTTSSMFHLRSTQTRK